ncbi:rod shape-determining protein MreD [Cognatishimia sp. D5M38]|uniref:Rod shape-determining protein MreD n=1 Tax=Cognatishimia coralii TaxID=3083254 RepID=A0ABU8QG13_9RHOB
MSENLTARLWLMRAAFVALALLVIFWQLLPMETVPRRFTGPDMLLVMCVLWVLRRPDYAPPVAIAGVMLLADFVFLRPPGLMALATYLVCENLRNRSTGVRDMPFSVEWLTAAGGMTAIVLGNRLLETIFLLDHASLGLTLIQLIMSVLAYPLVAILLFVFIGLRKINPSDPELLQGRV